MRETRGQQDHVLLDRELDVARVDYERALRGTLDACQEGDDFDRLSKHVGQHLLDHPGLAEDPVAAEIESMGSSLRDFGESPPERELGERVLSILKRLRGLGGLSPNRVVPVPVPPGLEIAELLEAWPELPMAGKRDLHHQALFEYHKSRRGTGRSRRRGVSALVDLVVNTSWNPYHVWRLTLLEKARDFAPEVGDVHFQIARHLKAYGEMAGARRASRRAVDLDPSAPEPQVLLAGFLEFSIRPREALAVYERVLRLRDRFGFEGLEREQRTRRGEREKKGARRSLSGRYRLPEVSLRRAASAALDGCARLRVVLGRPRDSLEAMVQLVRESPGETRHLRGLYALARRSQESKILELLGKELELRGGTPGGVLPKGYEQVPDEQIRVWLQELIGRQI